VTVFRHGRQETPGEFVEASGEPFAFLEHEVVLAGRKRNPEKLSRSCQMVKTPESIAAFLRGRRFAVAGVSRQPAQAANAVFRKLRAAGYEVFPINPKAAEVEGVKCYSNVGSVPGQLDGVVIATSPEVSVQIARECSNHNVRRVWLHRSFGDGSVSEEAVRECEARGIDCIVGGCPLMFCAPVDVGHKCMRWWLQRRGRVPR
jgi:predicted CoA-binding protein